MLNSLVCRGRAANPRRWIGVLLLLLLTTPVAFAYNPNQPQGFGPERSYQQTPALPDQVDQFSGRLSVTVPIGPFTLVYNNNVWRYSEEPDGKQIKIRAEPDRLQNAGLGWHLGWGELYNPEHWYNNSIANQWLYVGADGSRHLFYGALHRNEDDGDGNVYYTRDNSYLRLKKIVSGSTWDIEFPDGMTRRFIKGAGGSPYRLVSAWDRFGSASDPDLTFTYSVDDKLRTVTDRHGRHHYVHLAGGKDLVDGNPLSWMIRVVTQVDIQGVNGQRSVYNFNYRNISVNVSCKNTSSQVGPRIRLPHLTGIDLPDGTAYVMEEAGTPSYINTCPAGIDDAPGSLTHMQLPTGGVMRWTYQEYEFPPGNTWGPFNSSAGVATREAYNADTTLLASWNFVTRKFGGTQTTDPEVWTDVVALPEGDCTRHYFSAIHYVSPAQGKGWEYGLPFVRSVTNGTKFLSTEVYPSHNASNKLCSGTKLRTTYLRFRHDPIPGVGTDPNNPSCQGNTSCSRLDEWYNLNRGIDGSRTVFHDDGNRWVDMEKSEFDGIGNFRHAVSTGNLWSGSTNNERRETFTNFTRSPGTFPNGGYTHPTPSEPWILGVYDRVDTTELDGEGQTTSRMEAVFEDTTGVLECTRTLRSGLNRTLQDIVVTYDRDLRGNVTDVKTYGADHKPLPSTGGVDCGALPTTPAFWNHHEYDYDKLARTRPYQPNGTPGAFLTHDVTIDPLSGVAVASRDTAGYEVTYSFDATGRLTTITPQDGAATTLLYTNPFGTTGAKVRQVTSSGATVFHEQEKEFDSFGRVIRVKRTLPDGTWVSRLTEHNGRGWLLRASEWDSPSLLTQFLEHDAFGRPGRVRPPEGAAHDVLLSYSGIRLVTRSAPVQTTLNGAEVYTTRTRESDRYGRLRKILEPAGTGGSNVTTSYLYDAGGRLTRITSSAGSAQQVRSFNYDNRGFLLSETHPEKGASGNGTVSYYDFDTGGRYYQMQDGNHYLRYAYDYLGRIQSVKDGNQKNRLLRSFLYDSGPGFSLGKLRRAYAYNYLKVPANNQPFQVDVSQRFDYQGIGGAVSRKDTLYTTPSGSFTMRTGFQYDDGGNVTAIDYPRCVTGNCSTTSIGTSPQLTYQYSRGWLTSIPGWVNGITYHPSGLWSQIDRSNGVSDVQQVDTYHRSRVKRIYTTGASSQNWDSGTMSYDGNGNIKGIGDQQFSYDAVNRVTEWFGGPTMYSQQYTHDPFGNLTSRTGTSIDTNLTTFPVNPQTNRLTNAVYDDAGNVLNWNGGTYAYDPFNRLINQAWMAYAYDAFGERAASLAASDTPVFFHVRGLGNELLSTLHYDGSSTYSRQRDFVYANGHPLGSIDPLGQQVHYHNDHLGTQRLLTWQNGAGGSYAHILPYGEDLYNSTQDNRLFTGHERDFSMDTDYMHTRHYASDMGRFLSVDSFRGMPESPLSLNRYSYVMGNPVSLFDPDGREVETGLVGRVISAVPFVVDGYVDDPHVLGAVDTLAGLATVGVGTIEMYVAIAASGTGVGLIARGGLASAVYDANDSMTAGGELFNEGLTALLSPYPYLIPSNSEFEVVDFIGGTMTYTGIQDSLHSFSETTTITPNLTISQRIGDFIRSISTPQRQDAAAGLRTYGDILNLRQFGSIISPSLGLQNAGGSSVTPFCDVSGRCWGETLMF